MTGNRRPRGTPEQAQADIKAAIGRLAKGRPDRTDGKPTATNLATEAGMSRKQLYHYLEEIPSLASAWQQLVKQRQALRAETSDATTTRRIRHLEEEVEAWKSVAAIARAEAERQADINEALRRANEGLRAASHGNVRVVPLRSDGTVT